jgi:hypothetical protein
MKTLHRTLLLGMAGAGLLFGMLAQTPAQEKAPEPKKDPVPEPMKTVAPYNR